MLQGAKRVDLCVRDDNPADGVAGPDEGAKKAKQYLYPSEFLTLVSCDRVPIRWRRLFALAAYTYTRPGELAALEWGDVDLEHGTIHVHKSIDRVRKSDVGSTKTETARRVPIEPELLPLLRVLRERAGGKGAVCSMPSPGMLSRKLRLYLERAGVTRPELLVPTPTSKAMTFYDLRATGITWCAVRGDDPLKIKQRAGHQAFATTEIYIREAENIRAGFGVPFPTLPEGLMDKGPEKARAYSRSSKPWKNLGSIVGAIGFEPTTPTVSRPARAATAEFLTLRL